MKPGTKTIGECESCQFPGLELTAYGEYDEAAIKELGYTPHKFLVQRNYCNVCTNSPIGNATTYGYTEQPLYQSLGYCTNLILKAIRDSQHAIQGVSL